MRVCDAMICMYLFGDTVWEFLKFMRYVLNCHSIHTYIFVQPKAYIVHRVLITLLVLYRTLSFLINDCLYMN